MQETQTTSLWRILLRDYCQNNPSVKDELAKQLDIKRRALDRWIEPGSHIKPDDIRIRKLPSLVPDHEAEMRLSLERDYPSAFETADMDILPNIPSAFYARIHDARAVTAKGRVREVVMDIVYKQLAGHIDPEGEGIVILFARCSQEDGVVKTLKIAEGYGTNQWMHRRIAHPFRLGKGSICAQAVQCNDPVVNSEEDILLVRLIPILHADNIASCVACNVSFQGDVAGALFIAATQAHFFTADRCMIIHHYANAFALALTEQEFYPRELLDFQQIPDLLEQSTAFHSQQLWDDLRLQYPDETNDQLLLHALQLLQGKGEKP